MPVNADSVIVELEARNARYNADIANSERVFDRSMRNIQGSATRAEVRVVSAFRGMASAFGLALGAAGAVAGVRAFVSYVDAAKQLEAQLRLATRESGSFAQATEDVRRIAQETRTGLEETASLYAVFQRNARELGISQEQAARATETVSKSFQISGASAEEAAGGLRQFLQGVQSGTLRGEELNSVLENAPRLARLLADSLGVTIGQLRLMGQEGQLSADKLITALTDRRFTSQIDEEFRELPVTFDQAMTQINNAATVAFGAFDRGGDFSNALINFAGTGELSFSQIEASAFATGQEIRAIMNGLANVFDPMGEGAVNVFDFIEQEARGLRSAIADILGSFDFVVDAFDAAAEAGRRGVIQSLPGGEAIWGRILPPATPINSDAQGTFERGGAGALQSSGTPWWMSAAQTRRPSPRPRPPRSLGGGGGGRRRSGGGGGGARAASRPLTRSGELNDFLISPALLGRNITELEQDLESMNDVLGTTPELLDNIENNIPDLGNMLTTEDREELDQFLNGFSRDLADGLTAAIVYGEDLGDVLVSTIQRAAAELISSGLMQLLTGQGGGALKGLSGGGGILGSIASIFGGSTGINGGSFGGSVGGGMSGASGFLKGFASGGSFKVGGHPGLDRNILSINGTPALRVGQGETIGVVPQGLVAAGQGAQPVARVLITLTDDLNGRIVSVAGPVAVEVVREATPRISAEATAQTVNRLRRPRLNEG